MLFRATTRLASRAQRRTFASAAAVNSWKDLVSPWTPPEFIQRMKTQESKINGMKGEMGSTVDVPEIDWDHWATVIKTPGVVAEMKKNYEAHEFDDLSIADMEGEFKAQQDEAQAARRKSVWASRELERTQYCKGIAKRVSTEMYEWNQWQWMDAIPGMEEEIVERVHNEDWMASEREEQLKSFDFASLAESWKQGVEGQVPAAAERVGDIYPEEEMQLMEDGAWSIKRLYLFKEERDKLQDQLINEKQALNEQFPM